MNDFENDLVVSNELYEDSGFGENAATAFSNERRENLPIVSRWIADSEADQKGKRIIYDLMEQGLLTPDAVEMYNGVSGFDTEGALNFAEKSGVDTGFGLDEYREERAEYYAKKRAEDQTVFDRSTKWGAVGQFAGRMAASFTDPIYLATAPIGIGTSATILSAAARTAVLNGIIEIGAVPFIYDFKKEIGSQYGGKDALAQIGLATTFGGLLGGGGKALQKFFTPKQYARIAQAIEDKKNYSPNSENGIIKTARESQDNVKPPKEGDEPAGGESPAVTREKEAYKEKRYFADPKPEPRAGLEIKTDTPTGTKKTRAQWLTEHELGMEDRLVAINKELSTDTPDRLNLKTEKQQLLDQKKNLKMHTQEGIADNMLISDRVDEIDAELAGGNQTRKDLEAEVKQIKEAQKLFKEQGGIETGTGAADTLTTKEEVSIEMEKAFRNAERSTTTTEPFEPKAYADIAVTERNQEGFESVIYAQEDCS